MVVIFPHIEPLLLIIIISVKRNQNQSDLALLRTAVLVSHLATKVLNLGRSFLWYELKD